MVLGLTDPRKAYFGLFLLLQQQPGGPSVGRLHRSVPRLGSPPSSLPRGMRAVVRWSVPPLKLTGCPVVMRPASDGSGAAVSSSSCLPLGSKDRLADVLADQVGRREAGRDGPTHDGMAAVAHRPLLD